MDPALWHVERYTDFLQARRDLLARKLNEYMAGLIAEPVGRRRRRVQTTGFGSRKAVLFGGPTSAETLEKERQNPLGCVGQTEEIAAAAVFLAGPGARFMTGQTSARTAAP